MNISINTKLYGVIGEPIAQSLSPDLHNGLFEYYGMDGLYLPLEVDIENLESLIKGIRNMNFRGFNVTKPYKMEIIKYLDRLDPMAEKIGAVNTVVCENGELVGYNTDGFGFIKSIEAILGKSNKEDLKILILGCGGAVKSVAMALAQWGTKEIIIANRTIEKALDLEKQINENWPQKAKGISLEENSLRDVMKDVDILVNGTSLGMIDNAERTPISKDLLMKDLLVYDMIYNPEITRLLADAQEIGSKTENGLNMLLFQGLLAFELWTGKFPDQEMGKYYLEKGLKRFEE